MSSWTGPLPFFTEKELRCRCGCDAIKLDMSMAAHLVILRYEWDSPLRPNSVCRCTKHNDFVEGHPRSLHLIDNPAHPTDGSAAADIAWRHWPEANKIDFAQLAWRKGWSVGLHDGFCHIDRRKDAGLQQTVFLYNGRWNGSFSISDVRG